MASHFLFRTQFVARSHSTTVTLGLRSHRSRTRRPRESIFRSVPFWGQQQAGNVVDTSRDGATDFSDQWDGLGFGSWHDVFVLGVILLLLGRG